MQDNDKEEVVALLKQYWADWDALDNRARYRSDRSLGGLIHSVEYWYEKYPVTYAKQKLIARGSAVVPPLLEITLDQSYSDYRFMAWGILARVNYPDYLKEAYRRGRDNTLELRLVDGVIRMYLPVRISDEFMQEDKIMGWLEQQLAEKTHDEIVLNLIDHIMKASPEEGGLHPRLPNDHVFRWLNRYYDVDFDSWLSEKAPSVLKFRQKELAKGYDPATALDLGSNTMDGLLDEAMDAIYADPDDRRACKTLLEAVEPCGLREGETSPLHPEPTPGWEERLRRWYWSQRRFLQYDPTLLRFVSSKEQTATRPANAPASQPSQG